MGAGDLVSGIADADPDLLGDDVAPVQLEAAVQRHLRHDDFRLLVRVVAGEDLGEGDGVALGPVAFDVPYAAGLAAPRMVDQKLRVDAERFVQQFLRCGRDAAHRVDAVAAEPCGRAARDAPEVGDRAVIPQRFSVALLVEKADVIRCLFGCDVQGDLCKVQVRADPRGGGDVQPVRDFVHELFCKRYPVRAVERQIFRRVDEGFVDRVDMHVLRREIVEVDAVDVRCVVHVQLHPRERDLVGDALRDVGKAAAVLDALRLQFRRDGEAQGVFAARGIRDDEAGLERVEVPLGAFHGSVEGLHIDAVIGALRVFHRVSFPENS